MKQITEKRILQTLESINDWHKRINGWNGEVVQTLVTLGLQSVFDEAVGKKDPLLTARTDLELTVLEARKDPATLRRIMADWEYGINRSGAKKRKVYDIQAAAGISGIVWDEFTLDGRTIKYPWHSDGHLPWIEADLEELRANKGRMLEFFLQYLGRSGRRLWRMVTDEKTDYWEECPDASLLSATVDMADWCDICSFGDGAEVWFAVGSGLNPIVRGAAIDFCACHEHPSY